MAEVARIDENDKPTILAVNDTTGEIERVEVDTATGGLNIFITAAAATSPASINVAQIDANDNPTGLGYEEDTELIEALRCTEDGQLIVTVE
jgi:hypothetical protein